MEPGVLFDGAYLIEEVIGAGGFSTVYLATEVELERLVALKVMHPDHDAGERVDVMKERFFREARYLSQLQESQTIRLYHYGEAQSTGGADQRLLYMALEYVEGVDLRECVAQHGALDLRRAFHIGREVLVGLREVHSLGILHRDIKPHNVMITRRFGQERVKLLDFGIAKNIRTHGEDLTREGAVVGTPRYLTPEQIAGQPLGEATDIYSVGLLVYELCLGNSPHADSDVTTIFASMHDLSRSIETAQILPEPVNSFLSRCLAVSPDERFADAESAIDAVEEVLGDLEDLSAEHVKLGSKDPPESHDQLHAPGDRTLDHKRGADKRGADKQRRHDSDSAEVASPASAKPLVYAVVVGLAVAAVVWSHWFTGVPPADIDTGVDPADNPTANRAPPSPQPPTRRTPESNRESRPTRFDALARPSSAPVGPDEPPKTPQNSAKAGLFDHAQPDKGSPKLEKPKRPSGQPRHTIAPVDAPTPTQPPQNTRSADANKKSAPRKPIFEPVE